jgi:PAS domain S-box-containing protein
MSVGAASPRASSLRARLFRALAIACALPLGLLVLVEVTLFERFESMAARERIAIVAARIARQTAAFVLEHQRASESLALLLATHPMDAAETEDALRRFRERYPAFLTMAVVAASPDTTATGRPAISSAFRSLDGVPVVSVSVPVRSSAEGGRAVVLEGSLDLGRLRDVILPTGELPGMEAMVADANGNVVFSSVPGVEPLARQPPREARALAVDVPVATLGWTATARVASRAVHAERNLFLIATAGATLVALAVGFGLARRQAKDITDPLRDLVGALHSFEAGRGLDPPRPRNAPAEVVELFDGLSVLEGRLKVAHDELRAVLAGLEQEVQERTETLRESEERFRQLADNIDVVFWVRSDEQRRMLYDSPAYEAIWERPRSELERDPMALANSIHPDDRERALAAIASQPLGPYEEEYRIVCPSGEVKWIRSIGVPVHDAQGAVIRIAGLSEEVTGAHRLEQLRQDLTHTMVHDLRSPLTGVQAGIEAARMPDASPALRQEALDIALRSVRKLLFLIDAILDVSRLESGHFPLEMALADPSRVVADAIASLQALATAGRITVRLEAGDVPAIRLDEMLVRRVVENLVGNAIKFMPAGGTVRVRVEPGEGTVRVSVSDDGPGIEPELSARLFEKFVTGRRAGRGSGLGLAFCRLAVEAHGGAIGLDTVPVKGATFHFTLPAGGPGRSPVD